VSTPAKADALERRYLNDTFAQLCRIESPSGHERACAQRVIAELRALGVEVHEDDAGPVAGSDCGNLLARLPGGARRAGPSTAGSSTAPDDTSFDDAGRSGPAAEADLKRPCILLCAHLDTVPLQAPVQPVLVDGYWENANEGILGADNKAAVAVLLTLARRVRRDGCPLDIELLFTVGEERALAGARAFDAARLQSGLGYVFDHASPLGEVILASPSHFRLEATFHGAAAHAGIRPEQGRSAILAAARAVADMRLGRLDSDTTANVGTIAGGSAMNVVPDRCALVAEVRSRRDGRAEELVAELVDCVHEAANLPECECDVDVDVQRTFTGYRTTPTAPAVRAAEQADRKRRGLRRQRPDRPGADRREPRQRHRAQPRARRARQRRRARGHARSRPRPAQRCRGRVAQRRSLGWRR
jgi:tripeptide aminopeptidase